jgi:hypothetical protein
MSSISPGRIEEVIQACGDYTDIHGYSAATSRSFNSLAEAVEHYLDGGGAAAELIPTFDPAHYMKQVDEASLSGRTPIEHYILSGARQGLSPTPLFEPGYVQDQSIQSSHVSIFDYLNDKLFLQIDPHPLFSRTFYLAWNKDVAAAGAEPLWHYLCWGWNERRSIHPFFRKEDYAQFGIPEGCSRSEFNEKFALALENPGLAFCSVLFDAPHYLASMNADQDVTKPLHHYLRVGWRLNVSPHPLFDPKFFLTQTNIAASSDRPSIDPYVEYLSDFSHTRHPHVWFDASYYKSSAHIQPTYKGSLLEHFLLFGARDGAQPHRLAAVTRGQPSRHSGFQTALSTLDANGVRYWVCVPPTSGWLQSSIREASEIEPALAEDVMTHCRLHPHSARMGTPEGNALIAAVTQCARCNCLVMSAMFLDDELISWLLSSFDFVSSARPWLTLMSMEPSVIRFWHRHHNCRNSIEYFPPREHHPAIEFVARVLEGAMPTQLVVNADRFGIFLFRLYASRLFATCAKVTLLASCEQLDREDSMWLSEFIATNWATLHAIVGRRDSLHALGLHIEDEPGALGSRIFVID